MTLDGLHLELLRKALPRQYDSAGVMMPGICGRIGVRSADVRLAAKRASAQGFAGAQPLIRAFLCDAASRRSRGEPLVQEVFWTVLLTAAQAPGAAFPDRLAAAGQLAEYIDSWPACDLFGEALKDCAAPEHGRETLVFAKELISTKKVWRIRLALVILLTQIAPQGGRALREALALSLSSTVCAAARTDYYASMGLAWALSVYAVHDWSRTSAMLMDAVQQGRIDPVTARRTAQKIRESFRIAQAEKAEMSQNIRSALASLPECRIKKPENGKPAGIAPALSGRRPQK